MKLRYCLYCQRERDASTFSVFIHKRTGVKKYKCASCTDAHSSRLDPQARERHLADLAQRNAEAKRAWAQQMLQARGVKK